MIDMLVQAADASLGWQECWVVHVGDLIGAIHHMTAKPSD
jgi:hypothetical protein